MKWGINENQLERQSDHAKTFHTAFGFEHDGQPFFMQVEVNGHLKGKHNVGSETQGQAEVQAVQVPGRAANCYDDGELWWEEIAYQTPLDELARSIPDQMVLANMKQVPWVPGTQTGPKPLYQISAKTEETTIEEETVDALDKEIEQPYITNLLTHPQVEELRAGAMAVLSLGQPSTRSIFQQTSRQRQPLRPDRSGLPDSIRDDSKESLGVSTDAADSQSAQELDTAAPQDHTTNPPANSEQIERLLQEAKLPLILQLIILWLMSLGTRWPPLENRRLLSSTTAAD
ncbi:hypothetical protein PG994_000717 [Apiospora phragmitis]|uniref:Uncharacterized protein n=1 Tax=Apiospora phragmitis TaxID=2905665 RepID=A0ABR1X743_9PEZI